MKENNSRREFLSQSGKMVTAAALFGTSVPLAHAGVAGTLNCEANNTMKITDPHYYLDNVLLETGFDYENGVAVQTRTARQTVEIQDGKIVALRENKQHPDATLPHYDAGGKLMLPTTRDMHIHLDKTFYGGPWRSLNRPAGTTIQDMIKLEQKMLPELQPYTQERAEKLIDLLQSKGTTIARSHCNIEPVSGLKNLQNLQAVLARRQTGFECEIVAFPQHGLLLSKSESLMREAMQAIAERGNDAAFLIPTPGQEWLHGFYGRFGFDGAVPTEFVTPDGFDFGTGDTATDLAMVWRRDSSVPLPEQLTASWHS